MIAGSIRLKGERRTGTVRIPGGGIASEGRGKETSLFRMSGLRLGGIAAGRIGRGPGGNWSHAVRASDEVPPSLDGTIRKVIRITPSLR